MVCDRATRTLLVTDLVVGLSPSPPEILGRNDARALLFHARDETSDAVADTPGTRRGGWAKICLFALYFQSSPLNVTAGG